jgi:hypothetical protein
MNLLATARCTDYYQSTHGTISDGNWIIKRIDADAFFLPVIRLNPVHDGIADDRPKTRLSGNRQIPNPKSQIAPYLPLPTM